MWEKKWFFMDGKIVNGKEKTFGIFEEEWGGPCGWGRVSERSHWEFEREEGSWDVKKGDRVRSESSFVTTVDEWYGEAVHGSTKGTRICLTLKMIILAFMLATHSRGDGGSR